MEAVRKALHLTEHIDEQEELLYYTHPDLNFALMSNEFPKRCFTIDLVVIEGNDVPAYIGTQIPNNIRSLVKLLNLFGGKFVTDYYGGNDYSGYRGKPLLTYEERKRIETN